MTRRHRLEATMVQSLWWITWSLRQVAAHRLQHQLQPQRLLQRHARGDARRRQGRAPPRHRARDSRSRAAVIHVYDEAGNVIEATRARERFQRVVSFAEQLGRFRGRLLIAVDTSVRLTSSAFARIADDCRMTGMMRQPYPRPFLPILNRRGSTFG